MNTKKVFVAPPAPLQFKKKNFSKNFTAIVGCPTLPTSSQAFLYFCATLTVNKHKHMYLVCILNFYVFLFRFTHRGDYNEKTGQNQNDMFVRNDIVRKYNVKQLY